MRRSELFLCVMILLPFFSFSQLGFSCSTPIPIPMDSVTRTYSVSSATGSNVVCSSSGTSPVTYFSLVANSSAQNMILRITGPNTGAVEVAFYDGTSCTNGNLETASSICFYDGTGLWAPSENFVITPNQTYILRIKTSTTGTLTIQGYYYTPPNNSCATAMPIGTILTFGNNAAHQPATGISPTGVCAVSLTNTALYTYTVDYDGPTSISLENLVCDNNYQSDLLNLGFQVGIFKGSCAGLTNVFCYIGVPGTIQLNAGTQSAGTQMYIAINGILSSNCEYGIRAINARVLSATIKYFTVWKTADENILKWVSLKENDNAFFEIERSEDGINYTAIGRIAGQTKSTTEKQYEFTDQTPPLKSFYRLKMISTTGKNTYSNIVRVDRQVKPNSNIRFNSIVTNNLSLQIIDLSQQKLYIKIIDRSGREVYHQQSKINSGSNFIDINISVLSKGLYYLIITGEAYRKSFSFLRS